MISDAKVRAIALCFYIIVLLIVQGLFVDSGLRPNENAIWLYGGIASLLFGSHILNPYFTPPSGALINGVTGLLAILSALPVVFPWTPDAYASRQTTREERAAAAWRVSAADLEEVVVGALVHRLRHREAMRDVLLEMSDVQAIQETFDRAAMLADDIISASALEKRQLIANLVRRVTVRKEKVEILICLDGLCPDGIELTDGRETEELLTVAARITRAGSRSVLAIAPSQVMANQRQDLPLIKLVTKAYAARLRVETEPVDPKELARTTGQDKDYFARLVRLGYLAPDIITAILEGRQPPTLTRQHLARVSKLPLDWAEQRQLLGFASA